MEYSTVTGTVSYTVRLMSWFISRSLNSFDNILSVMLGISFAICLKRLLPNDKEIIIGNFHLPLRTSSASLTGRIIEVHVLCVLSSGCFFIDIFYRFTKV